MLLLYDTVLKEMDGKEELLTGEHCSKISMMDGEAAENIYLLILHHFVLSNKGYKQILIDGKENPFSGKAVSKDGKGLNFRVSSIPDDLQRILVRYLKMIS